MFVANVSIFIAVLALLISFWSALTAHRVARRQGKAEEPAVSLQILPLHDNWYEVRIGMKNPTPYPLQALSLTIEKPRNAWLVDHFAGTARDGLGHPIFNTFAAERAKTRSIKMRMRVGIAGKDDTHSEEAFLFVPAAARSASLRLRFRFSIQESTNRELVRVLRYTAIAAASTDSD